MRVTSGLPGGRRGVILPLSCGWRTAIVDSALLYQLNGGHLCPPDAGPAWCAACELGVDMSLIESNLAKTPWERWVGHDEALRFARELRTAVEKQHERA